MFITILKDIEKTSKEDTLKNNETINKYLTHKQREKFEVELSLQKLRKLIFINCSSI